MEYVDITRLDNREATGWLPQTLKTEKAILDDAAKLLGPEPPVAGLSQFQKSAAAKSLAALQSVR